MNVISRSLLLAAIIITAGCVTTEQLRQDAPLIDVTSAKSTREVAACITEKWEKSGIFGMPMAVDNKILADGFSVSIRNNQIVQLLADVREIGTGSSTKYYKPGFVLATGEFEAAVRDCQK